MYEESQDETKRPITKADLYEDRLTGGEDSASRRKILLKRCGLPAYLSTNALLEVLNAMMSYEEYQSLVKELFEEE